MKFSIKDFFSKCDQICSKLRIWSHLLKKSLMENFIFCAVFNELLQKDNSVTMTIHQRDLKVEELFPRSLPVFGTKYSRMDQVKFVRNSL